MIAIMKCDYFLFWILNILNAKLNFYMRLMNTFKLIILKLNIFFVPSLWSGEINPILNILNKKKYAR